MASSTSGSPQPKPGTTAVGFKVLIIVAIGVVFIAAVIGISFLPNPYFTIAVVIIYAGQVALIAARLITCLRLAQGTVYFVQLQAIFLLVCVGVGSVVGQLGDLFSTDNRTYIHLATNFSLYLSLLYSLELVHQLLRRGGVGTNSAPDAGTSPGMTSPPNQPLHQTGERPCPVCKQPIVMTSPPNQPLQQTGPA